MSESKSDLAVVHQFTDFVPANWSGLCFVTALGESLNVNAADEKIRLMLIQMCLILTVARSKIFNKLI